MPSPIRSFINLLAVAALIGLVVWREHTWRTRSGETPALAPTAADTAPPADSSVRESELLSTNGQLQKQLSAAEARAGALTAEVASLKQAIEAAKPEPVPADLAKQFAQQRGLAFDPAPVWSAAPLDSILEKVRKVVEAQLPVDAASARSRAAIAMGFQSDPFDYREALVSLAQMTNGGFYEASSQTFFYREEASLSRADGREIFIGGLASALTQRQAGDRLGNPYDPANDDVALAARSLINGDANASRVRFSIADQLNLNFDRNGAPTAPPPNYSAPVYLAEMWKFSQDKGSLFVEALAGQGGNATVDAAYARMPRSSAEILHPEELYLAKPPFEPVAVEFKEPKVGGLDPYFTNTAGELGAYIALRGWLGVEEATLASEGWAGDRYCSWPGEAGFGDHLFWKSVWRTEKDAKEFFDQMRRVIMQRFSIPWRQSCDALPGEFRVDDPRRVVRLVLKTGEKTVTLLNATDPAFAVALEQATQKW